MPTVLSPIFMTEVTEYTLRNLSGFAPTLFHVITTRHGGKSNNPYSSLNLSYTVGDEQRIVAQNRTIMYSRYGFFPSQAVVMEQIHSTNIAVVNPEKFQGKTRGERLLSTTDAAITKDKNLFLMALVADCAPILLFDPNKHVIGIIHSGWRGTLAGIAQKTVRTMIKRWGCIPSDILGGIGPSIGSCCFEVNKILFDSFRKAYSHSASWSKVTESRYFVSLKTLIFKQLVDSGVPPDNICCSDICTACNVHNLFSFRVAKKQGYENTGRFAAIIGMRE